MKTVTIDEVERGQIVYSGTKTDVPIGIIEKNTDYLVIRLSRNPRFEYSPNCDYLKQKITREEFDKMNYKKL
ncbi:MAG: hypothetical protein WCX48_08700 [Bacteroidales bacterium]